MRDAFRSATSGELAGALLDARDYTLTLFGCLAIAGYGEADRMPLLDGINPPLWELGHIAWFAERHVLRKAGGGRQASLLHSGDAWFDAAVVPRAARRALPLPKAGALKTYCHEVLDRVLDQLSREDGGDAALYPYRLALAHEDRRGEALACAMQALGVALPPGLSGRSVLRPWAQGEIRFSGGGFSMGSPSGSGFAFDNEQPAHPCRVAPFVMDSTLVSHAQFAEFIDDGGYRRAALWSRAGREWLVEGRREAPSGWRREESAWHCQRFGRTILPAPHEPARHISLYEAQAWCAWAGRRLPSEEEWEFAALSAHPALRWGDLWEWTCSSFAPYPGAVPGGWRDGPPYRIGPHQTVRGASFATPERMRSLTTRHSCLPERNHMFIGFRTCAL